MGKATEVSQEKIKRILELRSLGQSYAKIGRETGIDRRIAKKIIVKNEETERLRETGSARREVAGGYLIEHITDLDNVTHYLLQLTLPPHLRSRLDYPVVDLKAKMHDWLEKQKFGLHPVIMGETLEQSYSPEQLVVDARIAERKAREIIEGLFEHLPLLSRKLNQWEKAAQEYADVLSRVATELERTAPKLNIPRELVKPGLLHVIELIHNQGIKEEQSSARELHEAENASQVSERLLSIRMTVRQIKALILPLHDLDEIFEQLEDLLSPSQLRKTLITGHCKFCPVS